MKYDTTDFKQVKRTNLRVNVVCKGVVFEYTRIAGSDGSHAPYLRTIVQRFRSCATLKYWKHSK